MNTIVNSGIGIVWPGHSYQPAPFCYESPVPAGAMLAGAAFRAGRAMLGQELAEGQMVYLCRQLKLNPDYAGLTIGSAAMLISQHAESR